MTNVCFNKSSRNSDLPYCVSTYGESISRCPLTHIIHLSYTPLPQFHRGIFGRTQPINGPQTMATHHVMCLEVVYIYDKVLFGGESGRKIYRLLFLGGGGRNPVAWAIHDTRSRAVFHAGESWPLRNLPAPNNVCQLMLHS